MYDSVSQSFFLLVSRWCPCGVAVVSQWCLGGVMVLSQRCPGEVPMVFRWCSVSRWSHCWSGRVSVVCRWCPTDPGRVPWCFGGVAVCPVVSWCSGGWCPSRVSVCRSGVSWCSSGVWCPGGWCFSGVSKVSHPVLPIGPGTVVFHPVVSRSCPVFHAVVSRSRPPFRKICNCGAVSCCQARAGMVQQK